MFPVVLVCNKLLHVLKQKFGNRRLQVPIVIGVDSSEHILQRVPLDLVDFNEVGLKLGLFIHSKKDTYPELFDIEEIGH
jgi:hypothetical protein